MSGTRRVRRSPGAAIASSPWIVVSIGVIVMVVLLVIALGAARGRRPYADVPAPDPTMSLPGLPPPATTSGAAPTSAAPAAPGLSPRSTVLPSRPTRTPSGAIGGSGRPLPPPSASPPPPPASPVTGRYAVVSTFDGGFIGEVRMVNAAASPRGWTVRVTFSRGRLVTSWVESAEQGTADFTDGVLTYRSGVDVQPGASVTLRFHFEGTGTTRPAGCTVDGSACSGL
ncbi:MULTISPECIES: cellulose binding domain-containing protein [Micromonospora]|uniref:Cellulose-binding protein n=1 Tax=Micromonospora solifontis TaxID=2487138 RepID=A0ABX9WCU8_9ACTN|nr:MULTISPECIES: cellulose binding domain-containing protein [Micromonospora]NES16616.1 cellulose-binding protein [Micromonospora sp. PPF5-17B]NES38150.1 cellulose-binding protein [Micromonospora solifontis]NES56828.1 cellulose-binding protein [Micromonospora sp. PPF5-6]RNL96944.1 cellulose-binding protein [Micromonospora solifontis]